MTDPNLCLSALRRRLVSESNNVSMNSTANPRINPSQFIPLGRTESHPNVSGSGFKDESPYTGPGTWLQSQWNCSEIRVVGVMKRFGRLKFEVNEWERLINSQIISLDVINRQFNSLYRETQDLARKALLARVEFTMCGEISNYKTIINQVRQNAKNGIVLHNDLAPSLPNRNLDSVFGNELSLSTIDPPITECKGP